MNIAICDDCNTDREALEKFLKQYMKEKSVSGSIFQFENGANLVYDTQDGMRFDMIFMEINMSQMSGVDAARRLRDMNYDGEIVFVTASRDYGVESYEVEASGYLLKPATYHKLSSTMDRVLRTHFARTYCVKYRNSLIRIRFEEILYIESNNSRCLLFRSNGEKYYIYKRLSEIEAELADSRFLRCHRSYIVNMDYITCIDKQFAMVNGDTVLIRQKSLKEIRCRYFDYIEEKDKLYSA